MYFKDAQGEIIKDEVFYQTMQWDLSIQDQFFEIRNGYLQGVLEFASSGEYQVEGRLADKLGTYQFRTSITIHNMPPAGKLPEGSYTPLSKEVNWDLDQYFTDAEDDQLEYSLHIGTGESAKLLLENHFLTVKTLKSGIQTATLMVSDGEDISYYPVSIHVLSLWQAYWWLIVIIVLAIGIVLGISLRNLRKPSRKPQLTQLPKEKTAYHFNGRLDACFTMLPEGMDEIPPLVFTLYKVRGSKLCLGDLLREYPAVVAALQLDAVYFLAVVDRKVILFHSSDSAIMLKNSIVCKQIRYDVSFGDVIYITSEDGTYDLELRYISVIQ